MASFWGIFSREDTDISKIDHGPQEPFTGFEARLMEMLEAERRERRAAIEELWAHQQELISMVRTCLQMRPGTAGGNGFGADALSKQYRFKQQERAEGSPMSSGASDVWPSSPALGMTPEQELMQFIPSLARGTWSISESKAEDDDADSEASGSAAGTNKFVSLEGHPLRDAAVQKTWEARSAQNEAQARRGSSLDAVPETNDPMTTLNGRRQLQAPRRPLGGGSGGALGSTNNVPSSSHSRLEEDPDDVGPSVSAHGTPRLTLKEAMPGSRVSGLAWTRQERP
mmetsp:Transcript_3230/g.7613  ORF Transcript_3230/g.7613 Transcript_3230/m.7613 type:complete len:284 (+) Transcript_3230:59-910(+)